MANGLSTGQLQAISDIERACSVLSLLGCVFTIFTFSFSSSFHKPINRIVFYASFGNMMTNVGTLMSREYLELPNSVGCQLQAFLIQTFMPADAFWTLAMAFNVYLTIYHQYGTRGLRRMEPLYLILCYGIPFVPAFTYIFVKNHEGQRTYGNATLWCWITTDWDVWRIASFYAPVWVVISITFFIYIRAGRTIYEKRKQLKEFQSSNPDPLSVNGDAISTIRTTEVTITSEAATELGESQVPDMGGRRFSVAPVNSRNTNAAYSVHVSSESCESGEMGLPIQGATTIQRTITNTPTISSQRTRNSRRRNYEINNAAWGYTKCAILFFTAILITWIPSSANRVYSVVHDKEICVPLEFMSAFVLPLQGFWNAVIYMVTSWSACKSFASDFRLRRRLGVGRKRPEEAAVHHDHSRQLSQFRRLHDSSLTDLEKAQTCSMDSQASS